MKTFFQTVFSIFCMSAASTAASQESGFHGEVSFAEVSDLSGLEVGVGYHFTAAQVRLTPMIGGFIYQGELEGFQSEAGGICRDLSNGQFSDSENCDATEIEGYGKLEASLLLDALEIGLGYRTSDRSDEVYGVVGFRSASNGSIKVNAGENYLALVAAFSQ